MKTTWLIGWVWKCSNVWSWPVLIGRGLDLSSVIKHVLARPIVKKVIWTLYGFESISGGYYRKDTPVPIPNTAVKLPSAKNTWMATSRENRSLPDLYEEPYRKGAVFSFIWRTGSCEAIEERHWHINTKIKGWQWRTGTKWGTSWETTQGYVCILLPLLLLLTYRKLRSNWGTSLAH